MRFSMDTDQVRMMASALRQNADSLEAHMAGIRASVQAANWQSQAREEYVNNLETLIRVNAKSIQAMRLMARAAERKADQWEAIANKFNGPFYHLEGIWNSFLDHLNNTWQGLLIAIGSISLPSFAFIPGTAQKVKDWFDGIEFPWEKPWPPEWWPFDKNKDSVTNNPDIKEDLKENITEAVSKTDDKQQYESGQYLTSNYDLYPQPKKQYGTWKGYCAAYVNYLAPEIVGVGHAKDWINKHNLSPFVPQGDLRYQIEPGDVVVWNAGQQNQNETSGHAAVIIEVHEDYVVLAETGTTKYRGEYDPNYQHDTQNGLYPGRILRTDKLENLYIWSNPEIDDGNIHLSG